MTNYIESIMNKYKEILEGKLSEEDLEEKNFEYTKPLIGELEGIIKKLKKGTFRFNEVVNVKKIIQELKTYLSGK